MGKLKEVTCEKCGKKYIGKVVGAYVTIIEKCPFCTDNREKVK